jgi:hypothetical protein
LPGVVETSNASIGDLVEVEGLIGSIHATILDPVVALDLNDG